MTRMTKMLFMSSLVVLLGLPSFANGSRTVKPLDPDEPVGRDVPTVVYDLRVVTDPASPQPGEPVTFYLTGQFPGAGFSISIDGFDLVDNTPVMTPTPPDAESAQTLPWGFPYSVEIKTTVKEPEGPYAQVLTPFRANAGTLTLQAGTYPVNVFVNGEVATTEFIYVGTERPDDGEDSVIRFTRSGGFSGGTSWINIQADGDYELFYEFSPSPNGTVEGTLPEGLLDELVQLLEDADFMNLPELLQSKMVIADGYLFTTIYQGKTVAVEQEAPAPDSLWKFIDQMQALITRLGSGSGDGARKLIGFTRSGGFSGGTSWVNIQSNGNYELFYEFKPDVTFRGTLPDRMLDELVRLLEAADFINLPELLEARVEIADGYLFTTVYQGKTVAVEQEASAPDELWKFIDLMQALINRVSSGPTEPNELDPDAIVYDLRFFTLPDFPTVENSVDIAINGYFPTSGYEITRKSVTVDGSMVLLEMDVTEPDAGLTVLTPFRETFELGKLPAGDYLVILLVNGEEQGYHKFFVESEVIPRPFPSRYVNNLSIEMQPEQPVPGDTVTFYLNGEFPGGGFEVVSKSIELFGLPVIDPGIGDGSGDTPIFAPNIIRLNFDVTAPEGGSPAVIVPFREEIGSLTLGAGFYFVQAFVNSEVVLTQNLGLGTDVDNGIRDDAPVIEFTRTGGFAGDHSWLRIFADHQIQVFNRFRQPVDAEYARIENGQITPASLQGITELLEEANFKSLPDTITTDKPIADGFTYRVTYDGRTVTFDETADAPEAFLKAIELLYMLLDDPTIKSLETFTTSVNAWAVY